MAVNNASSENRTLLEPVKVPILLNFIEGNESLDIYSSNKPQEKSISGEKSKKTEDMQNENMGPFQSI